MYGIIGYRFVPNYSWRLFTSDCFRARTEKANRNKLPRRGLGDGWNAGCNGKAECVEDYSRGIDGLLALPVFACTVLCRSVAMY